MGIFAKGLLGLLLGGNDDNSRNRYGSYSSSGGQSAQTWECRYCGRKKGSFQRPSAKLGGGCQNSPYGTHYWDQI